MTLKTIHHFILRKDKQFIALFLFLGFVIRISYVLSTQTIIKNDAIMYDGIAQNLLSRRFEYPAGIKTVRRGPIYPAFLAAIYFCFGHNHQVVRMIQAGVDILTCICIYFISRMLFKQRGISLFALVFVSFYLPFLRYVGLILTETLYSFLLAAFLYSLLFSLKRNSTVTFALSGILLGINILCKPTMQLFPLILFFFLILTSKNKKKALKHYAIMTITMILIIIPWTIRNYFAIRQFVCVTVGEGQALMDGVIPRPGEFPKPRDVKLINDYNISKNIYQLVEGKSEYERDKILRREALQLIFQNKTKFVVFCFKKFLRFWFHIGFGHKPAIESMFIFVVNASLLLLAAFGIPSLRTQTPRGNIFIILIVYFTLIHIPLDARIRYAIPILPYVMILAANGTATFLELLNKKMARGISPS